MWPDFCTDETTLHCTDETQKIETVALSAVVLLPIVRSINVGIIFIFCSLQFCLYAFTVFQTNT